MRRAVEVYDDSPVQLSAVRPIDLDYVEAATHPSAPKTDKYGFTGGTTKTVMYVLNLLYYYLMPALALVHVHLLCNFSVSTHRFDL